MEGFFLLLRTDLIPFVLMKYFYFFFFFLGYSTLSPTAISVYFRPGGSGDLRSAHELVFVVVVDVDDDVRSFHCSDGVVVGCATLPHFPVFGRCLYAELSENFSELYWPERDRALPHMEAKSAVAFGLGASFSLPLPIVKQRQRR